MQPDYIINPERKAKLEAIKQEFISNNVWDSINPNSEGKHHTKYDSLTFSLIERLAMLRAISGDPRNDITGLMGEILVAKVLDISLEAFFEQFAFGLREDEHGKRLGDVGYDFKYSHKGRFVLIEVKSTDCAYVPEYRISKKNKEQAPVFIWVMANKGTKKCYIYKGSTLKSLKKAFNLDNVHLQAVKVNVDEMPPFRGIKTPLLQRLGIMEIRCSRKGFGS